LFFISFSGQLYCYDYGKGIFTNLSKNNSAIRGVGLTSIIKSSTDNTYWFSTDSGILNTNFNLELISKYQIPDQDKNKTVSNRVSTIYLDKNGVLWLGMLSRGVYRFDTKRKQYLENDLTQIIPKYQQINAFYSNPNTDEIFVATGGEGLIRINTSNYSYRKWQNKADNDSSLPSDRVTALCSQGDSILWVGTLDGMAKLNVRKNKLKRLSNNPQDQYSLSNNSVYNILLDNQNILWVATAGGICKLNTNKTRFTKVSQDPSRSNSLSSNRISQCFTDKYGNLWIASSKGINVKSKGENRFYHYDLPKSFPHHKNEEVIKIFSDGDIWWIGTWGGGISRFILPKDFKPGNKLYFSNFYNEVNDEHSISSNFIRDFVSDKEGNIWVSTWNGGLNLIRSTEKMKERIRFVRFISSKEGVASDFIDQLACDSSGSVWLATTKGLQRFDFKNNKYEMIYSDKKNPSSSINIPTSLLVDKQNNIWFSHFSGITKVSIDEKGNYLSNVKINERKYGSFTMTMDNDGNFWFSTHKSSIGSYNPRTNQAKLFSMTEEVGGYDFYFGEATTDKVGNIYFGGNSGYLTFHPNDLYSNKLTPPIFFTSIKIAGEDYKLNTDVSKVKELLLDYDQRNISVSFAALNYIYPEKNEYKYILEGLDGKWVVLGNKNEITFANLPAGNYKLKVIGSNNDAVWNYQAAVINIAVKPPFWQNNYYRLIFVLLIAFGIYLLVTTKIKRLKEERQRQNLFSKLLIESQEEERKRLSQELHDSLGQNLLVIKNQIDMYKAASVKDISELEDISGLIKESISEVKSISSDLHPHQLERLGLLKAINAMVNKIRNISSIEIVTELFDLAGVIPKEAEINIYRIIQESLNNIVKHSQATKALICLTYENDVVRLDVEDDGIGFDINNVDRANKFTEGLGLKSIRERVRMLNGKIEIDSSKDKGTKISITIKIG